MSFVSITPHVDQRGDNNKSHLSIATSELSKSEIDIEALSDNEVNHSLTGNEITNWRTKLKNLMFKLNVLRFPFVAGCEPLFFIIVFIQLFSISINYHYPFGTICKQILTYFSYIQNVFNIPIFSDISYELYVDLCIIIFLLLIIEFFFYLLIQDDTGCLYTRILGMFIQIINKVLYIPFMMCALDLFRISWDTAILGRGYEFERSHDTLKGGIIVSWVLKSIYALMLLIIGFIDSGLIYSRFGSTVNANSKTQKYNFFASTNSRFQVLFFFYKNLLIFIDVAFSDVLSDELRLLEMIPSIVCILASILMILYIFRHAHFYNRLTFCCFIGLFSFLIGGYFTSLITVIYPHNEYTIISLGGAPLIAFIIVLFTYILRFFVVDRIIKKNLKAYGGRKELRGTMEKIFMSTNHDLDYYIHQIKDVEMVADLMEGLRREKDMRSNKFFIVYYILYVMEKKDQYSFQSFITNSLFLLLGSQMDSKRDFMDLKFLIGICKMRKEDLSISKRDSSFGKELKYSKKMTDDLMHLYSVFFSALYNGNCNSSKLMKIFSKIEYYENSNEKILQGLLKKHPGNVKIIRNFAKFVSVFKNDKEKAKELMELANSMEIEEEENRIDNTPPSPVRMNSSFSDHDDDDDEDDLLHSNMEEKLKEKFDHNHNDDDGDGESPTPSLPKRDSFVDDDNSLVLKTPGSLPEKSVLSFANSNLNRMGDLQTKGNERFNAFVNGMEFSILALKGFLVFFAVTIFVAFFISYFFARGMKTRFTTAAEKINTGAVNRKFAVQTAHLAKKMQISKSSRTLIESELLTSKFQSSLAFICNKVKTNSKVLFESDNSPWEERYGITYSTDELFDFNITTHHKNCIEEYVRRCNIVANYNISDVEKMDKSDLNLRFILLNMNRIFEGNVRVMKNYMQDESDFVHAFTLWITILPPSILVCVFVVYLVIFLWLICANKSLFKAFKMIPRGVVKEMYEKFNGSEKFINSLHKAKLNGITPIQVFKVYFYALFGLSTFLIACIIVIGVISSLGFTLRNNKVNYAGFTRALTQKIHYYATEVAYPELSLMSKNEIKKNILTAVNEIADISESLVFGDPEKGLTALTDFSTEYEIFMTDSCVPNEESSFYETIDCLSLIKKFNLLIESGLQMINAAEEKNITTDDLFYKTIMSLDDSALQGTLQSAVSIFETSNDDYLSMFDVMLSIILGIFIPLFCILVLIMFIIVPKKLEENFKTTKRIFLLLPRSTLQRKDIYAYLTGESSSSILKFTWLKKRRKEKIDAKKYIQHCSYPIVCFNSSYNIVNVNESAKKCFKIKNNLIFGRNVLHLFSIGSQKSIKRALALLLNKQNKTSTEVNNVEGSYNNCHYPCNITLMNYGSLYVSIMRGTEEENKQKELLIEERKQTEHLLLNIFPEKIALKVKKQQRNKTQKKNIIVEKHDCVSILFADIVGFTKYSSGVSPEDLIEMLNILICQMDDLCDKYNCEKIKTIGDCYFACAGLNKKDTDHADHIFNFGLSILSFFKEFNDERDTNFQARIGINTGMVVSGVIGKTKSAFDIWGSEINLASKMESSCPVNSIQISGRTFDFLKNKYPFEQRNDVIVKGKGKMTTYVHTPMLSSSNNETLLPIDGGLMVVGGNDFLENEKKDVFNNNENENEELIELKEKKKNKEENIQDANDSSKKGMKETGSTHRLLNDGRGFENPMRRSMSNKFVKEREEIINSDENDSKSMKRKRKSFVLFKTRLE